MAVAGPGCPPTALVLYQKNNVRGE
jgi:hypothetical protein